VFEYDWRGRRIRKTVTRLDTSAVILDNKFLCDGWNLIAELNGTNNTVIRSYTWGLDLSGSQQGAGGVGGLLMVKDASQGTHFAAYDLNGNMAGLVSASYETNTARHEYGLSELLRATGPMAKLNPFRFSTKYQDDETDLVYYGYRYYNASTGRWLSRDPIEELGGMNLYGFLHSDPQNKVDLYGLTDVSGMWEILKALPLPADLVERLYAWMLAQLIDNQFVKITIIENVDCPKGASAKLLSELDTYLEDRNEITLNIVDYDVIKEFISKRT
jgi:RHS repeat-associated protein